jgi:lysophospholipase L1-like esterase
MALSSTTTRQTYTGNGATAAFAFTMRVDQASWLKVDLDEVEQATGFSVELNADQGASPGGTVTFLVPPGVGVAIRLRRAVPLTQEATFGPYTRFPAQTVEQSLDQVVMAAQDTASDLVDLKAVVTNETTQGAAIIAQAQASAAAASAASAQSVADWVSIPGAGRAELLKKLAALKLTAGRVTWVGDSITEQGKTAGQGFTHQLEQAYQGITYSNQGVGGNTTLDVIARLPAITATAANLYVLAIGVNDARYNDGRGATTAAAYVANMTTIVNALKAAGGDVVVLSIWPTYGKDQFAALGRKATDDRFREWNAALETYCKGAGVPFVDAYTPISRAVGLGNVTTLAPDGVHPDYNGAAYIGTAGAKLYAAAILRGSVSPAEFVAMPAPAGKVFYKLVVPDNGAASDWISVQNLNPAPAAAEFYAYSGNPAVDVTNLVGAYNGAAAGFLNKAGDWPAVITFSSASFLTSLLTVMRGQAQGIRAWELYVSTDPAALTDPSHPTWVLHTRETSTAAWANNLAPAKRRGVFYRLQVDSSKGSDGTGGTTGIYVKVSKVWGGTPPVRWAHFNGVDQDKLRGDLIFSAAGGNVANAGEYLNNAANTYPYHLAWEAEDDHASLVLASDVSGGATARGIKAWSLYRSTDPASLTDAAHSSWVKVASGTGDQTVPLAGVAQPIATLTPNSTTPSVAGGKTFVTANTAPTTITEFTGGVDGQEVTVIVNDTNTSFSFVGGVGKFRGNGGQLFAAPQYASIRAIYSATLDRWLAIPSSPGVVSAIDISGTLKFGSATMVSAGAGTPEGVITAPVGSIFLRTNGGAATTLYVKESGAGNTGWVAK